MGARDSGTRLSLWLCQNQFRKTQTFFPSDGSIPSSSIVGTSAEVVRSTSSRSVRSLVSLLVSNWLYSTRSIDANLAFNSLVLVLDSNVTSRSSSQRHLVFILCFFQGSSEKPPFLFESGEVFSSRERSLASLSGGPAPYLREHGDRFSLFESEHRA